MYDYSVLESIPVSQTDLPLHACQGLSVPKINWLDAQSSQFPSYHRCIKALVQIEPQTLKMCHFAI